MMGGAVLCAVRVLCVLHCWTVHTIYNIKEHSKTDTTTPAVVVAVAVLLLFSCWRLIYLLN